MKTNVSEFPEFFAAVKNDSLVYLFGTGISSAITGQPYSWKKWIIDGTHFMNNSRLAEQYSKSLETVISTDEMVSILGNVMSETKKDGTYSHWMKCSFESNPITNTELVETLKRMVLPQDVFATTNYDTLLEQATGLKTLSYENPEQAYSMLDQKKSTSVLHMHGVYDSRKHIDNIIADQEQYNKILNDEGAQFIQHILGTRTLILIGCGQTTEDANISRFIEFANKYLNMQQEYFFLCKKDMVPESIPENMKLIPYGSDYNDLPAFMEDMIQTRLRSLVEKNPIIGRTAFGQGQRRGVIDPLMQYHYSQEKIPFCGRREELSKLGDFVKEDDKFKWWAITGQAGVGKSRLALELIKMLPSAWFGFFINDKAASSDIQNFVPFSNTLVVVDYVSGQESVVADLMRRLSDIFERTPYFLRILLIERDNSKKAGSWYGKLKQRFGKYEMLSKSEYQQEFLNIADLDETSVDLFIDAVCLSNGLPSDYERDRRLRTSYGEKFEKLRFRPLYVQIFVEAWIFNDYKLPRYDCFEDLLNCILKREQERWLASLDGDQLSCNAMVRLLLRANISGTLEVDNLPDYYLEDWKTIRRFVDSRSFPGKQRVETQNSIINSVCQNIDSENCTIEPLFPDVIKEYMFSFYADEETLQGMLQELWENAAHDFSIFITRCLTDFPENDFYKRILNIYENNTINEKILIGRLELLNKTIINDDDDPYTLIEIIYNEYDFWKSIAIPTDDSEKMEHISSLKFLGLDRVAVRLGGWSLYDVTPMMEAIDEALKVSGGKALNALKQIALHYHITELAQASFSEEAACLAEKLEALISEDQMDEFSHLLHMNDRNVEMMNYILTNQDFANAVRVLRQMEAECSYSSIESAKILAHSCFNLDNLAFMLGSKNNVGVGYTIAHKMETIFPDDWSIRSRALGCKTFIVQKNYFMEKSISKEELKLEIKELEDELATMKFGNESSDEELNVVWGTIKFLKFNVIGTDEAALMHLVAESDAILLMNPKLDMVVATRIKAVHIIHKSVRKDKVSREEVEEAFKYVEQCFTSNCVRSIFFEMLEDSDVADSRNNYITKRVAYGARQGARYDPIVGSGIPEFDLEADLLRMDFTTTSNTPYHRGHKKIGANEQCPCGSGKKFKKCCRGNGRYD